MTSGRLAAATLLSALLGGPALADTLQLTTGERLNGKVVSDEGPVVVFDSEGLGRITVARERVASIEKSVAKEDEPPAVAAAPVPDAKAPQVEDRTASELPQEKAPPPSAPPPEKREDLLRLWVDQGLRYQIVQPVQIPTPFYSGESLVREEVRVTGRIGIRLSADVAGFETSHGLAPVPSDAVLRTLRFYTNGSWSPTTTYALQLGVIDGNPYLHQANVRWTEVPYFRNVNFGYIVVQQTLENVLPFGGTVFMEPALPVLAFAPGNRMGVTTDRQLWGDRGALNLGIYSVGADPGLNFGDETQSLLRPTLRLTGLALLDEQRKGGRRLLHLGASGSLTIASDSEVRYRARPESFIAPYLVDTGNIKSRGAAFVGTELVWMSGPFTLQGEAMVNRINDGDRSIYLTGLYATTSWMLTGEEAGYNKAVGVPDRIIPTRDFSWKESTWGAWQLGLRLSYVDLDHGSANGGRMTEATAGLNWWWNRYLRWMFNYNYAIVEGGSTPGHLQVLQARIQLMY
ncbi:MAG: OprO/OprP family phosphate-selective porin [Burkholderiales bacterium]|nr:OprO/OprP family phosphate-selective porin [Burkholderiales bacterium]